MKIDFLLATNEFSDLLCATIDSCLQQETNYVFNVVIVCNGVNRFDICSRLKTQYDSRVKILVCNVKGLISALNYGLSFCDGDLVARIDTGDLCDPHRLQKQVEEFNANESLILLGGQMADYPVKSKRKKLPLSSIRMKFLGRNPIAHPTAMYRLNIVRDMGGYKFPDAAEDYGLWLEILSKNIGDVKNLDDTVTYYYFTSTNETRRNLNAYFGIFLYSLYLYRQTKKTFLLVHAMRNFVIYFVRVLFP